MLKDNEIVGLDEDISELKGYLATAKDKLEIKIQDLLQVLEENKRVIRKQDKHIVDLQQRNEISQMSCNFFFFIIKMYLYTFINMI